MLFAQQSRHQKSNINMSSRTPPISPRRSPSKKSEGVERSPRQLKVGEEIRHVLAGVFMRGDVPWSDELQSVNVSVTEVRISPDLQNATVFVMTLGGEHLKPTVKALNAASGFFRHAVGKAVMLRVVPRLKFIADESFENAQKIANLLVKSKGE